MPNDTILKDLDFATRLCSESGKLLLQFFHHRHLQPSRKADRSLVTEADVAVDTLIHAAIQEAYPEDFLISEELNPIISNATMKNGWIIDPLDGTTNFVLGLPYWGILITKIEAGYPVLSAQYFPVVDELYQIGNGYPPTLNGNPIRAESETEPGFTTIFSCCSRTYRHYQVDIRYKTRIFGCAGYSLSSVARGISRIAFEATAKIWDLAAAWVLIPHCGGEIGVLLGDEPFPIQPDIHYQTKNYPVLAAASKIWFNEAKQSIKSKK
ncbi:MAG: inositol monophosphatase family protein [Anaerolineales bacterium]